MRALVPALLAAACLASCAPAEPLAQAVPGPPQSLQVLRSATTVAGQPIALPNGPIELVVTQTNVGPGGVIPMHRHRWPRYVRVEEGVIRLTFADGGPGRDFGPGDVIVEAIDTWHEGRVIGPGHVRLVAFDLAPPGQSNMERRDPA